MIEPTSVVQTKNPQKKQNTLLNTFNGMITGSVIGDIAAMAVPIREDEFVAAEKELSKKVTPKVGHSLRELSESMIKNNRAVAWGGLGTIAGGLAALTYSVIKNFENKKDK